MLALFLLPGSREKARLTMAKKVSKKERKENAKEFYYLLQKGNCDKVAIVVRKIDSSNVNYCRCQFLSVISNVAWGDAKVIADSKFGAEGCFRELLSNIYPKIKQVSYYDDSFGNWLARHFMMKIVYKDGLVYMLERVSESEVE